MRNERHDQTPRRRRPHGASLRTRELVSCSICLRVLWDGTWSDSGALTRVFRTPENATVVHLRDGLCDRCRVEGHLQSPAPLAA